jgi:hypothetical protein
LRSAPAFVMARNPANMDAEEPLTDVYLPLEDGPLD